MSYKSSALAVKRFYLNQYRKDLSQCKHEYSKIILKNQIEKVEKEIKDAEMWE